MSSISLKLFGDSAMQLPVNKLLLQKCKPHEYKPGTCCRSFCYRILIKHFLKNRTRELNRGAAIRALVIISHIMN